MYVLIFYLQVLFVEFYGQSCLVEGLEQIFTYKTCKYCTTTSVHTPLFLWFLCGEYSDHKIFEIVSENK